MNDHDAKAIEAFFSQADENGTTNAEKAEKLHRTIRRVQSTPKDKSYEDAAESDERAGDMPIGVVEVDGKFIGLGIHILNEDVYPLQSFEIYLRDCDLVGHLDLSGCVDVVFVDLYRNRLSSINVANMPSLRILGLQRNKIEALDPTELPACQGIDAGMNQLRSIDVSRNPELVELYVNDNHITSLDTSRNPKLKYLRCQNNELRELDTTTNTELRHLYATGNPLKRICALAPGRDGALPLEISAGEGGCIGLSFNPIYNAQWKETGEWEQSYHAYPDDGSAFAGWYDKDGTCVSRDQDWTDEYGQSRQITARFEAHTLFEDDKNPILVSACLLGEPCRYDSASMPCAALVEMAKTREIISVCPEQLGGLPTPRTPSEIQPNGRVIDMFGADRTAEFEAGACETLHIALEHGCKRAILKENSPSCGSSHIYDGTFSGTLIPGKGKTAALLAEYGIETLSENDLTAMA